MPFDTADLVVNVEVSGDPVASALFRGHPRSTLAAIATCARMLGAVAGARDAAAAAAAHAQAAGGEVALGEAAMEAARDAADMYAFIEAADPSLDAIGLFAMESGGDGLAPCPFDPEAMGPKEIEGLDEALANEGPWAWGDLAIDVIE